MTNVMTEYQRDLVVEHMDLVTQVIRRRIKVNGSVMLTFDDFYRSAAKRFATQQCGTSRLWASLRHLPAFSSTMR